MSKFNVGDIVKANGNSIYEYKVIRVYDNGNIVIESYRHIETDELDKNPAQFFDREPEDFTLVAAPKTPPEWLVNKIKYLLKIYDRSDIGNGKLMAYQDVLLREYGYEVKKEVVPETVAYNLVKV